MCEKEQYFQLRKVSGEGIDGLVVWVPGGDVGVFEERGVEGERAIKVKVIGEEVVLFEGGMWQAT